MSLLLKSCGMKLKLPRGLDPGGHFGETKPCAIAVGKLLDHHRPRDNSAVGTAPLGGNADAMKTEFPDSPVAVCLSSTIERLYSERESPRIKTAEVYE
jgi:hypothetical protein